MNQKSYLQLEKKINYPDVTLYTPDSPLSSPVKMLKEMFRDLYKGRELAWRLAVRDINAQYRQTALGILWAFILPVANTITWIFLSSSGIVTMRNTDLPYPIYLFSGTIIWAIFIDAVNAPLQQTVAAKQMLAKINFPREALIVSGIYQTLINSLIKIALMFTILTLSALIPLKMNNGWTFTYSWGLICFPFGVISLILTGTVLGLLITPVGILYADIGKALPLLLQFLMYLTPVVFPMTDIFKYNPITPLILTTRDWLTGFSPAYLSYFLIINSTIIVLLLVVWIVYRAAIPILIERMSA
jgi:lipopolysaccharide transport system permease protein